MTEDEICVSETFYFETTDDPLAEDVRDVVEKIAEMQDVSEEVRIEIKETGYTNRKELTVCGEKGVMERDILGIGSMVMSGVDRFLSKMNSELED